MGAEARPVVAARQPGSRVVATFGDELLGRADRKMRDAGRASRRSGTVPPATRT